MAVSPAETATLQTTNEAAVLAAAAEIIVRQTTRVWVSGNIVFLPPASRQVQQFADWGLSDIYFDIGFGDTPPCGYERATYQGLRRQHSPMSYLDEYGYADNW